MSGIRFEFVSAVLGGLLCLSAAGLAHAAQKPAARKHSVKQVIKQEEPTPPAEPPAPLTLQQLPATPPEVSYRNNQLTIVAQNATLTDILRQVHAQTGAAIDMPANSTERVVGRFGPGPARDVMAKLLNGSPFNYVMVGSAADPGRLEHLVLTNKAPETPEKIVQQADAAPNNSPVPEARQVFGRNAEDANDDQDDTSDSDVQSGDQPAAAGTSDQPSSQPAIKTPEQLLQELQRQQQLQGQQQQQGQQQGQQQPTAPQNGPGAAAPPTRPPQQ